MDYSTINTDFVQKGPLDHGSVFDLAFGNIAAGASRMFNIFYGAAATLQAAKDSIAALHPRHGRLASRPLIPRVAVAVVKWKNLPQVEKVMGPPQLLIALRAPLAVAEMAEVAA